MSDAPIGPGRLFDVDAFMRLMDLSIKTHAGHAIVSASVLDRELKNLLLAKMKPLSNNKQETLFDGFGPLSEFAAKIEMAHAFDLIDEQHYLELRAIKKIRDEFAHTPAEIHFRSPEIIKLLQSLKDWNAVIDPFALFGKSVANCIEYLKTRTSGVAAERGA